MILFYEFEKVCLHFSGCHGFRHILAYIVHWDFEFLYLIRFQLVHDFGYGIVVKFTFFKSDTHTASLCVGRKSFGFINIVNNIPLCFFIKDVGLSMMCYTLGKLDRTCFGDFQLRGRIGKLL